MICIGLYPRIPIPYLGDVETYFKAFLFSSAVTHMCYLHLHVYRTAHPHFHYFFPAGTLFQLL